MEKLYQNIRKNSSSLIIPPSLHVYEHYIFVSIFCFPPTKDYKCFKTSVNGSVFFTWCQSFILYTSSCTTNVAFIIVDEEMQEMIEEQQRPPCATTRGTGRKAPSCRKCGAPRKGHKRGQCD